MSLAGHWQEEGGEDQIERSWFFTKGDPNLSSEDFIAAGRTLAQQYNQTALIISRQGVVTLETPEGEVWATLTTAGAVEDALLKLMQARGEFNEGKRPGVGYSDQGSDWLSRGWDTAGLTPEQAKASSLKPGIFVTVPVNNFGKWGFSTIGLNYPDWKILEK